MPSKKKAKALGKTKKIGGKRFTKSSCSRLKTELQKKAERKRKKGYNARVLKNPTGGYCLFVAKK